MLNNLVNWCLFETKDVLDEKILIFLLRPQVICYKYIWEKTFLAFFKKHKHFSYQAQWFICNAYPESILHHIVFPNFQHKCNMNFPEEMFSRLNSTHFSLNTLKVLFCVKVFCELERVLCTCGTSSLKISYFFILADSFEIHV